MIPKIGAIDSYWYFYLGAIPVHALVAFVVARQSKVSMRGWALVTASYAFGMLVGAKALFDLIAGRFSLRALLSVDHYIEGGLWGGPVVVLGLVAVSAASDRPNMARTLDYAALTLPIPMCVAHVGCLVQGCCYGRPTVLPWGLRFPEGGPVAPSGAALHPTQLYEVVLLVVIMLVFSRARREPVWRGMLLPWFLAIYGLGRAAIEVFRGDRQVSYAGISVSQVVCLAVGASCLSCLALVYRHRAVTAPPTRRPPHPTGME